VADLDNWLPLLTDPPLTAEPADPVERLLTRLLALDTATWLVASAETSGTNLPINLVQLSLAVTHDWARYSQSPDSKVAGMSLDRFGGFLKRSWRINDWIWGRLDAAHLLCQVVLDPIRLRRIHAILGEDPVVQAKAVLARLGEMYGVPFDASPGIEQMPGYDEACDELVALFTLDGLVAPPSHLPRLAAFAALPLQWRIILEELPFLASAIVADNVDGQNERSRGNLFLKQNVSLLNDLTDPEKLAGGWQALGDRALRAFDAAGVGREDLGAEAGSDAIIQTAANAAAVGVTVLDSDALGVTAIKPFTRGLRGAALFPYWLITGLTRGSSFARSLALFGFAVGGVLLALGLLGGLGNWSAAAAGIGGATVLSAFAYSALRTGSLLHGVVLLAAVVPLAVYVLDQRQPNEDAAHAVATVFVLTGVALALVLLGSLPWPLASPYATVSTLWVSASQSARLLQRVGVVLLATAAGLIVVGFALSDWAQRRLWDRLVDPDQWPGWTASHPVATTWVAAVLLIVAGGVIAFRLGLSMRLWRRGISDTEAALERVTNPAGVAASWAAVYGAAALLIALGLTLWFVDRANSKPCGFGSPDTDCTPFYEWATVVWYAFLAVVLIAVAPTLLIRVYRRRLGLKLAADPTVPRLESEADLIELLLARDHAFSYLVADPSGQLTRRGRRLQQALTNAGTLRERRATARTGTTPPGS